MTRKTRRPDRRRLSASDPPSRQWFRSAALPWMTPSEPSRIRAATGGAASATRLASSLGAPAQRLPGTIKLLRDRVQPLAVLHLTAALRSLQELVLLAD